jgi:hypothetical protein
MAIAAVVALAAIAVGYWQLSSNGDGLAGSSGLSQRRVALLAAALKQAASSGRPVYQYSVISGGAYNAQELGAAIERDPVVAAHYENISLANVRAEQVKEPRYAYVSYRKGDQVYWTKNKVRLNPGETILTDGETQVRARCGNCISSERLGPVSDEEPEAIELDALMPGAGGSQEVAPLLASFPFLSTLGAPSARGASAASPGSGASPMAGGGAPGIGGGGFPGGGGGGRSPLGVSAGPNSLSARAPGLIADGGDVPPGSPGEGAAGGPPGGGPPGSSPGGGSPGGGSPGGGSPGGGPPGGGPPGAELLGGDPAGGEPPTTVETAEVDGPPTGGSAAAASVPEPMTIALIGTGLAGLALRNRRRRR